MVPAKAIMTNKIYNFKRILFGCILAALMLSLPAHASEELPRLLVFHSPTCHKCIQTIKELMPRIEKEYRGRMVFEYRDISDIENYKLLLSLEEKQGVESSKMVIPIFYFQEKFLNGEGELGKTLPEFITQGLSRGAVLSAGKTQTDLIGRFFAFSPFAVAGAGLIDGVNPCAFTVIVFFVSFLSLQGYKRKQLVIVGCAFIIAVFFTYILIGVGLFGFLYRMEKFWVVSKTINIAIGLFTLFLGFLAFYDFFKFKRSGQTEGLKLQLPQAVKNRIHSVIGKHYRNDKTIQAKKNIFNLTISAFVCGFLISILEAVCTGQVYLPTIAFVLKTTSLKAAALGYLVLYNIMFVIPLVFIFILALFGVTSGQFSGFLKRHLASTKIAMAVLFFGLGIFLIIKA